MPNFQYTAMDRRGQTLSGLFAATTKQQAIASLATEGRFVTDIGERDGAAAGAVDAASASSASLRAIASPSKWFGQRRVPLRYKTSLFTQLSTALSAGLPLL